MFTDISGEWVCMRAYVCVHNSNSNSNNNNNNTMLVKMENQSVLLVYLIDTNNNLQLLLFQSPTRDNNNHGKNVTTQRRRNPQLIKCSVVIKDIKRTKTKRLVQCFDSLHLRKSSTKRPIDSGTNADMGRYRLREGEERWYNLYYTSQIKSRVKQQQIVKFMFFICQYRILAV